jgi:hypothetical protein
MRDVALPGDVEYNFILPRERVIGIHPVEFSLTIPGNNAL